jgi:hypothetical protein
MTDRDPLLNRYVKEQGDAAPAMTSHLNWEVVPIRKDGRVFKQPHKDDDAN